MEKNIILDLIKKLAERVGQNIALIEQEEGRELKIYACKYLLGQILRQYNIPSTHYLISEKAKEKWDEITTEPINEYWYRKKVVCQNDNVEIKEFVGNSKTGTLRTLKKGDTFTYRDVFHDEHIVTINDVINELVKLNKSNNLNNETVIETLDKIYICRMLKSEDRDITPKKHRNMDYKKVIEDVYMPKIKICDDKN